MQTLITHGSMARTRVLQFQRWQRVLAALVLAARNRVCRAPWLALKALRQGAGRSPAGAQGRC